MAGSERKGADQSNIIVYVSSDLLQEIKFMEFSHFWKITM